MPSLTDNSSKEFIFWDKTTFPEHMPFYVHGWKES
jgi:hypothetical protein